MANQIELASEPQKAERDRLTFAAWGERLSVEQYCARELRLRAHRWAAGALQTWLLVDRGGGSGRVLASCEVYAMRSTSRASEPWFDPEWRTSFGIATVYTELALRGKGYASELLTKVIDEVVRRDFATAHSVILFSDVGAPIYERLGFVARPAEDWEFAAEEGDPGASAEEWLDGAVVDEEVARWPLPSAEFIVWPTPEQVDWHIERERTYAALLGRAPLAHHGVRAGRSRAIWAADFKGEQLKILMFSSRNALESERVVQAARRVAHAAGLASVACWATEETGVLSSVPTARRIPRDGSLPMLLPIAGRARAEAWSHIERAIWM